MAIAKNNVFIISKFDEDYPFMLRNLIGNRGEDTSPLILNYKGNLSSIKDRQSIAIIGTRHPTKEGEEAGMYYAKYFAEKGFNIVSGLALGCDTIAHKGALSVNGTTTAILAHGLQMISPKRNEFIAKEILEKGNISIIRCADGCEITADKILLSVGRISDLSCLGKMKNRIQMEKGKIVVDDFMRTNIPNIYAAGDINGRNMLAHAAFKMGETAAENAMKKIKKCKLRHIPSCIYTIPECSGVGVTEKEAEEMYGDDGILIGKFPFSANGRALASGAKQGFVKIIAEKRYRELLGVHIFGGNATEMISEAASLMAAEIPVDEIADIVHAHPTFSEAFMEACGDAVGTCLHLPKRHK